MYPGFQIMGSSGPLLEKFGGPLLSLGVQLIYSQQDKINIREGPNPSQVEKHVNCLLTTGSF